MSSFADAFYFGLLLWLFVSLGALAQLMTHHLTQGRWGYAIQRPLEAALVPLPWLGMALLLFALFTPVFKGGTGWFEFRWIILRIIICFACWMGLGWRLRHGSVVQDESTSWEPTVSLRRWSGFGLVLLFLTVSLAMTDWVMNLQPGWRSTIFPLILMASQTVLAVSAAIVFLAREKVLVSEQTWLDLGTLLFAFVIFWAYVTFSQFLIVWSGNLPAETVWYIRRGEGGWKWMGWAIGALCFFLPAFVLLFRRIKRSREALARVALGIWFTQVLFLYWVIAPLFDAAFRFSVWDLVLPVLIGLVWGVVTWRAWRARPPFARRLTAEVV